jgi:hypothetical protein
LGILPIHGEAQIQQPIAAFISFKNVFDRHAAESALLALQTACQKKKK